MLFLQALGPERQPDAAAGAPGAAEDAPAVDEDLEEDPTPTTRETSAPPAPKTAKQLAARRNQEREAIKSRFGGNVESKKMQKNVLKHQFENFSTALNESLDKAYDRFQKLISQLEVHGAPISKEDINQKFLRSLQVPNSLLKILGCSLSSENTSRTNEVSTAGRDFGVNTAGGTSQVSSTLCGYVDYQSEEVHSEDRKELKFQRKTTCNKSKVECYNCHMKWHFARECRSGRNQQRRSYGNNGKSNAPTNESSSQALVAQDGLGGYDWSNDFKLEPINYALMAISSSSSSSSSDNEVQNCSKQCVESFKSLQKNFDSEREKHNRSRLEIQGYEIALESLESRILGHEMNELAWGEKYDFQNYKLKCREIKINNL
ncbi:putative ribonuclease H-like domain-containing protein [Tanacetum coccineum]